MKKLFLVLGITMSISGAFAQNKTAAVAQGKSTIGYIATDEIIGLMPEAEKLDAELKEYQASLAQQGQDMMKELNDKDSLFVRDSAKLSPSMKEIKKNELVALYQRAQNWNQQAQELYQQEAQKKIAPLRDKAIEAIRAAAKEGGYTYILDSASVIVGPPGDNILPLVKQKLGIKDAPAPKKAP